MQNRTLYKHSALVMADSCLNTPLWFVSKLRLRCNIPNFQL